MGERRRWGGRREPTIRDLVTSKGGGSDSATEQEPDLPSSERRSRGGTAECRSFAGGRDVSRQETNLLCEYGLQAAGSSSSRLLKDPLLARLLKKVQMQGGVPGTHLPGWVQVRGVLSSYVAAPPEHRVPIRRMGVRR